MKHKILIGFLSLTLFLGGCGGNEWQEANASLEAEVQSLEAVAASLETELADARKQASDTMDQKRAAENQASDAKQRQIAAETRADNAEKKLKETEELLKETLALLEEMEANRNPYEVTVSPMKESEVPAYTAQIGDSDQYLRGIWEKYSFYDLNDHQNVGVLDPRNLRSTAEKTIPYEAFYGVKAQTRGYTLLLNPYNHFSNQEHPILKAEIISDLGDSAEIAMEYGETTTVDCSKLAQGLYQQKTTFDDIETSIFFYVASNGVFTVKVDDYRNAKVAVSRFAAVKEKLDQAGVTPENSLYIGDIVYPCQESEGHRCDTGRWAQLSHDLLDAHPDWSDEMKVFYLSYWMTENIAYDDWKVKNGHSRAYTLNVWDGTYAMWETKVGVCADFSNVMVIMLREQGIPATSFESQTHMWNVVYLDGRWRELDITDMLAYHVNDFEHENWTNSHVSFTKYLGYCSSEIVTVGDDIWTIERANRK